MKIKSLKQPNPWTCLATVCCMIVNKPIEDFYKVVGHDGSGYWEESKLPKKVISFWDHEGLQYLATHCYFPMVGWPKEAYEYIDSDMNISITFNPKRDDAYFIVTVKSRNFEGVTHVILYHKGKIYDPDPNINNSELNDYQIEHIYPVSKICPDLACKVK